MSVHLFSSSQLRQHPLCIVRVIQPSTMYLLYVLLQVVAAGQRMLLSMDDHQQQTILPPRRILKMHRNKDKDKQFAQKSNINPEFPSKSEYQQ